MLSNQNQKQRHTNRIREVSMGTLYSDKVGFYFGRKNSYPFLHFTTVSFKMIAPEFMCKYFIYHFPLIALFTRINIYNFIIH